LGVLRNTVNVSGNRPDGASMATVSYTKDIPLSVVALLSAVKSTTATSIISAGQQVPYRVTVANTGNAAISNLTVADPLVGMALSSGDINGNMKLDVGETWTYTGTYTVLQSDIDNYGNPLATGVLRNTAIVAGKAPNSSDVGTSTNTVTLPLSAVTSFSLSKSSPVTVISSVGQLVPYTVTVRNTGNTAISNIVVSDPMISTVLTSGDANGNGKLDVGETWTYNGTYAVKQSDIDNNGSPAASGYLINTVSASGRKPDGTTAGTLSYSKDIQVVLLTSLNVVKSSTLTSITSAGQQVPYTITVRNTGNAAISSVAVNDPMISTALASGDSNGNMKLDVGETWTYTGTYTVKQSDIDNNGNTPVLGVLRNTVNVSGNRPDGASMATVSYTKDIPLSVVALLSA
ncbi:MAG: DUF11 domain-containing protein, partial [Sphingobacteriales bacterium]